VQAPKPKLDLSGALPPSSVSSGTSPGSATGAPGNAPGGGAGEEVNGLRAKRETEEKRMQQLRTQLENLQEIKHNQAHPLNLVVVKKNGTPVLARPGDGSRVLFTSSTDDEFEFIDGDGEWIHVQISGASRGYVRRSSVEIPEFLAARLKASIVANQKPEAFRVEREQTSTFPGDWQELRGKSVKIYTVQPVSQDSKETSARARLSYATSLFREFSANAALVTPAVEGVVVIFDSADGGIIGATLPDVKQLSSEALTPDAFWKRCYLDPPEAFKTPAAP
jgi:hypothetical protein